MTVEIAALCEGASVKNGQVCILHTFSNWQVIHFPANLRGILVAQVRFLDDEEGDHRMYWELNDADGALLWKSEWAVATIKFRGKMGCQGWPQLWAMDTLIESVGQHELVLKLDEQPVASLLLAISQISQNNQ